MGITNLPAQSHKDLFINVFVLTGRSSVIRFSIFDFSNYYSFVEQHSLIVPTTVGKVKISKKN